MGLFGLFAARKYLRRKMKSTTFGVSGLALDMVERIMSSQHFVSGDKEQFVYLAFEGGEAKELLLVEGGKLLNVDYPYIKVPKLKGDCGEYKKELCRILRNFIWDSTHSASLWPQLGLNESISRIVYGFARKAARLINGFGFVPINFKIYILDLPDGPKIDCGRYDVFGKSDYVLDFPKFKNPEHYSARNKKLYIEHYEMEIAQVIIDALKIG